MRGLVVATGGRIAPFGDPVGQTPIANRALSDHLEEALCAAGADRVGEVVAGEVVEGPALVATDDLFVSPELCRAFVEAARRAGGVRSLAVGEGAMTAFSGALQEVERIEREGGGGALVYPLVYVPPGATAAASGAGAADGAEPLVIEVGHDAIDVPIHEALVAEGRLSLPLGHENVMRVGHWVHVLRANQLALLGWGGRLLKVQPWRLLWAAVRAMSLNKYRVMQKLTVRGRGCDIHPSAVVEASVLGDNVRVGANAVVRFSNLADGAVVGDLCSVEYSTLGPGASVSRTGLLQGCVLYAGANTGVPGLQLSVVGRGTFVGGQVVLADFRPRGNILVRRGEELVDSGTGLLGCAVGHGSRLMMGAAFYPGRDIPGGLTILGPMDHVVAKIDPTLSPGELLVADGGRVKPLDEVRRRLSPPPEEGE